MAIQLQLRRGTAAQWTSTNPILRSGEPGVETDTTKIKIGDGTLAWNSLAYASSGGSSDTSPVLVAWSTVIPLDTAGGGKYMARKTIDADTTLTEGAGSVQDGSCNLCLVGDGIHTLNIDALNTGAASGQANNGYVFDNSNGQENLYAVVSAFDSPYIYGQSGVVGRITFSDAFTGSNGSAPNARWTGSPSGWEIDTNHLHFIGASYGTIVAACTPGNNTISVDIDLSSAGSSFAGWLISYIDANNATYIQLNGSEVLTLISLVAGVPTTIATDTGHTRCGATGGVVNVTVSNTGNSVTCVVAGGTDPGTFGPFTVPSGGMGGAFVGLGINLSKVGDWFDNFVLS